MKSKFLHLLIVSLGMSLLITGGMGQQPKPQPQKPTAAAEQSQEKPEVINVRRVRLPITVMDHKKQFVSGLTENDFLIFEDKVPQKIDSFTSEQNNSLPLYVAVLMDTSPSTAGKLKFEQESASNFIYTVVRARRDRALFATFDDQVTLRQDFTDRFDLLDRASGSVWGASHDRQLGAERRQASGRGEADATRRAGNDDAFAAHAGPLRHRPSVIDRMIVLLYHRYVCEHQTPSPHGEGRAA